MKRWDIEDVDKYIEGLSKKQKRLWLNIANTAHASLSKNGRDEKQCDEMAVSKANGILLKQTRRRADYDTEMLNETIRTVWESIYGDHSEETDEMKESSYFIDETGSIVTCNELGEVMKTVDGKQRPASDFLVVEDPKKPTTWHLPVKVNGKMSRRLMGAAKAALTAPGGYRGNKYEGPEKAGAIKKLKAMYKDEGLEWKESEEMDLTVGQVENKVREAFWRKYNNGMEWEYSCVDVCINHVELGTCVIALELESTIFYQVPFEIRGEEIVFAPEESWVSVRGTWVPTGGAISLETENEDMKNNQTTELVEKFEGNIIGHAIKLNESKNGEPLSVDTILIVPGWGNKRDNNFYSESMLKRCSNKFVGAKMYATDHRESEKSVKTWVSTVKEIKGYDPVSGAPIGEVFVHKDWFAQDLRNLAEGNLLDKMECSILALGTARKEVFEKDGRKGHEVESIDEVLSVDWVTRAGAGGHATNLSENEDGAAPATAEEEETTDTTASEASATVQVNISEDEMLESKIVAEYIGKYKNLPKAAVKKLGECKYATVGDLETAIKTEIDYLKEVIGSGKPSDMGVTQEVEDNAPISKEKYYGEIDEIMKSHGVQFFGTQ
jgi:hypothetical protein